MIKIVESNKEITEQVDIRTLGLRPHSYGIEPPTPKTNYVAVPGMNGSLDLTEAFGQVVYENRQVTFSGLFFGSESQWHQIISDILNRFDGTNIKAIFENDPRYYWEGRCTITHERLEKEIYGVSFTMVANPYKYPLQLADENWLWDPFDFENGVIRKYTNIAVSGTKTVDVIGYQNEESPKFRVKLNSGQASMRMTFEGTDYYLMNGLNSFPQISIASEDIYEDIHTFTFRGYGTVTIDLKGGIL